MKKTKLGTTSDVVALWQENVSSLLREYLQIRRPSNQRSKDDATRQLKQYYISAQTGEMAVSRTFFENNNWYYADAFGCLVQGAKVIDGKYYFNKTIASPKRWRLEGTLLWWKPLVKQVINQFIQIAANQWAYL